MSAAAACLGVLVSTFHPALGVSVGELTGAGILVLTVTPMEISNGDFFLRVVADAPGGVEILTSIGFYPQL